MRLSPVINFHRHGFFAVMLILVTLSFSAQVDKAAIAGKGDTALAVKKSPADTGTFRDSAKTTAKSDSLKKEKKQDLKDTVHYESDDIDYDAKGRILRLTGHAKVAYQNMKLVADTIVYTMADNLFTANGKPMLIEDKDTTIGDFMVYNIKTKRGRVRTATTHVQDAYFTGQRIMKTKDNELFVAEGEYTTCEFPDTPHYFFYGERIRLKPDDKIISKPVVLNIGDAPVVYLPYFIFPVERNRKSGFLTPIWGGNPAGGGYVDHIGYYWAPNDYYDLTASARVQEFSQFIANASSKYNVRYLLNGGFDAHYTFNSDFLNSQRQWSLDYNHSQTLTPDGLTTLSGRGSLVSTQSFYSTYSMDSNQLIQQDLTANMSYSKQFPDINASLSVDWDRDQNLKTGLITSDMPHVNFSLPDRPLIPLPNQDITSLGGTGSSSSAESDTESRWYNSIYWNYTGQGIVRSNETGSNQPGSFLQPGMQNSLNLSAPQKLFKYIIITPNASATLTTLRGYSDTAVLKIDTVHDTITYTSHSRSDTARYPGYRLLPPITSRIGDTLGEPDTIYSFMVTDSNTIKRYHTDSTKINNILGWNVGTKLSTNLYGVFPIHILNFVGMRHTFSPSISYSFLPRHDLDKTFFPIGISPEGAHDRQQNVTFSLHNLFEGKLADAAPPNSATPDKPAEKPKETKFNILTADISSAYNFEAKSNRWSNLSLSASTGSTYGLSFNSTFWMYDNAGKQTIPILQQYSIAPSGIHFSAHGKLWDGDRLLIDSLRKADPLRDFNAGPQTWNISFNPNFTFSASRSKPGDVLVPNKDFTLSASADCGLTRNWKFSWSGNYNPGLGQMVQNSFNAQCDLECWDMRIQWRPETLNPGYYFIINIKKIPDIKWEQRSNY